MNSSRIFVRGLPPNITNDEFRRHFATNAAITDAKVLPNRRIGYVGYPTPMDAAKAVQFYNKSYIRSSRLSTELARPIKNQVGSQDHCKPGNEDKKRKRELDAIERPKLREFLDVMQPSSKSAWGNKKSPTTELDPHDKVSTEDSHEDITENAGYAATKEEEGEVDPMITSPAADPPNSRHSVDETQNPHGSPHVNSVALLSKYALDPVQPTASNEDWLRSKTSRLLGLVDDDDEDALTKDSFASRADINTHQSPPEQIQRRRGSEASTQTDEVPESKSSGKDESLTRREELPKTARLFVRNLAYAINSQELRDFFQPYSHGSVEGVHLPLDRRTGKNKGFAYVQFNDHTVAQHALEALDGTSLQGRLLHIIPADPKTDVNRDDSIPSNLPLKTRQKLNRRNAAASTTFNWNSMFMNPDAIMSSISDRLGVSKSELLDPTSSDAAVKQAHAETHVIQETKAYFVSNGVNLEAFNNGDRGETAILVKNFPYEMKLEDLRSLFATYGTVSRLLMPPSGTIAIVGYEHAEHAKSAFSGLAYRKVKDSILFLEKAPKDLFSTERTRNNGATATVPKPEAMRPDEDAIVASSTLFVRNLNFSTTSESLQDAFKPIEGFISAKVKTKSDPKKAGQTLSMGFGFVDFRTKQQAQAALAAMDGSSLDGYRLLVQFSQKTIDAAEERRRDDLAKRSNSKASKIIIKNLPFEATKRDVRSLFGPYGQLRSVRVPKKFDMSIRGFAFAEFVTPREAQNAMAALRDTHLLGRRLVLQFAAEEAINPDQEIAYMQKKVGTQADKVALQKLIGTGRKKFNVGDSDEVQSA